MNQKLKLILAFLLGVILTSLFFVRAMMGLYHSATIGQLGNIYWDRHRKKEKFKQGQAPIRLGNLCSICIHMNGRVYDPGLGRFLSVDPVIQSLRNRQSDSACLSSILSLQIQLH